MGCGHLWTSLKSMETASISDRYVMQHPSNLAFKRGQASNYTHSTMLDLEIICCNVVNLVGGGGGRE